MTALLLLPASLWFLFLLVLPLVVILVYSVGERAPAGGYAPAFTLAQYANLSARWTAFQNTLTLAPVGTLLTLLAAYPMAYWLALRCPDRWRLFCLVLVIVPFWTSLLIRTYAWIFILGGGKVFFIGNALVDLFLQSRNWPFGAAVSMALVLIMLVAVTIYMRLVLGRG